MQLARVLNDAKKLVEKHAKPFMVGLDKKNRMIMISQISEGSKFVAPPPLSCVVTKSGVWSVSEMRSDMIWNPSYRIVTTTEIGTLNRLGTVGPLFMLYEGVAYGRKSYGVFEVNNKEHCVLILESVFEDAVRMPRCNRDNDDRHCIVWDRHGEITIQPNHGKRIRHREDDACSVEVNSEEFLNGDTLLREKVSAARETYEKFCQIRENA